MTMSQPPASGNLTEAPIPKKLRDLLEEFPECIVQLEVALAKVVAEPASIVTPLERAVWAIEGVLEDFNAQARDDLEIARRSGDAEKLAAADKKLKLMRRAYMKQAWIGDEAFSEYISK